MSANPQEKALLEWVNSLRSSSEEPALKFLSDVSDGKRLWEILVFVDSDHFSDGLVDTRQDPLHRPARLQNLKTIHKRLNYYLSKREVNLPSAMRECNIDAMAMEGSASESIKFVKIVLIAALNSPRNSDIIKRIAELSTSTQEVVRNTIEESQQFSESEGSETGSSRSSMDHASLSGPAGVDELYHEEQLAKLTSERNKLANEYHAILRAHDEAEERAGRLEEANTLLQSRLERAEDQDGSSGLKVKHLQDKIKQKDGVIANLESRNEHLEQKINVERSEHEKTRVVSAKAQQYKDDFDEITAERDRLLRQANVANKYKQKLEATAALEKENVESRRQLDKFKHQLAESEAERRRLDGVAVNIEEYQDVLSRSEQELAELRDMNKRLKFDNTVSEQRCGVLEAERQEDQKSIQTLKSRLKTFDLSDSPDMESSNRDLDNELTNGEMTKQEAEQLESENEQLKSLNEDLQGRMKILQATLDDLNRRNTLSDKRSTNTAPNNKRRSSRLSNVSNADDIVSLETFHDLKAALEEEKRLRAKMESELATSGENDSQRPDHSSSLEGQQEDNLSRELSSTLEAVKTATRKQVESDDDKKILDQHIELLAEKVSGSRLRLLKQREYISQQALTIEDLESRLSTSKVQTSPIIDPQKSQQLCKSEGQLRQQIEALERENRLMASAYHSLASRLQMNNVTLQRRDQQPWTWLQKQRKEVLDGQALMVPSR